MQSIGSALRRNPFPNLKRVLSLSEKLNNDKQFKKYINPIEHVQCPEFTTTPTAFISGTTSTDVIKGTLLSDVRGATFRIC